MTGEASLVVTVEASLSFRTCAPSSSFRTCATSLSFRTCAPSLSFRTCSAGEGISSVTADSSDSDSSTSLGMTGEVSSRAARRFAEWEGCSSARGATSSVSVTVTGAGTSATIWPSLLYIGKLELPERVKRKTPSATAAAAASERLAHLSHTGKITFGAEALANPRDTPAQTAGETSSVASANASLKRRSRFLSMSSIFSSISLSTPATLTSPFEASSVRSPPGFRESARSPGGNNLR